MQKIETISRHSEYYIERYLKYILAWSLSVLWIIACSPYHGKVKLLHVLFVVDLQVFFMLSN